MFNSHHRWRRVLLEAKANVTARDWARNTALHWAAAMSKLGAMKLLVAHGADVNARTDSGTTPLHRAQSREACAFLLENGAAVDVESSSPVPHLALPLTPGTKLTPLYCAIAGGHCGVVQCLLERSPGPRSRGLLDGRTLLHFALQSCHPKAIGQSSAMLRILLQYCEADDLHTLDSAGSSVLHAAIERAILLDPDSVSENVKLLVAAGANVNLRDRQGNAPLHLCADPEVIRALVENGADVLALHPSGNSCLHSELYSWRMNEAPVLALLSSSHTSGDDAKALVNMKDSEGKSALQVILGEYEIDCSSRHRAWTAFVVKLLIEKGAMLDEVL